MDLDTTGVTGGNISFLSTLATAGYDLSLDAGTAGNITLSGALTGGGAFTARSANTHSYLGLTVASVSIQGAVSGVDFAGDVSATGGINVVSSGSISQNARVLGGTNLSYSAGTTIAINNSIAVSGTVNLNSDGTTTLSPLGDIVSGGW